jgi:neutral ceramidase
VWDRAPSGKEFGSVALDAASEYRAGEEVKVTFWGGHPNNSIAAGFSYLNVEQKRGAGFTPIRFDWDPDTTFEWRRVGLAYSQNTVRWEIPLELTPGSYRICHQGAAKPLIGPPRSYRGCSREFLIQAQPAG